MAPEKLAHMANQIAIFFQSQPREDAVKGVAGHINDFWELRMRAELLAMLEVGGPALHAYVVEAAPLIRKPR
jgi:formate dehydrogenase subunit delta